VIDRDSEHDVLLQWLTVLPVISRLCSTVGIS